MNKTFQKLHTIIIIIILFITNLILVSLLIWSNVENQANSVLLYGYTKACGELQAEKDFLNHKIQLYSLVKNKDNNNSGSFKTIILYKKNEYNKLPNNIKNTQVRYVDAYNKTMRKFWKTKEERQPRKNVRGVLYPSSEL